MSDRLITAPTAEPVTVAELKSHLRITHTADDAYIAALISAARDYVEQQTGRATAEQEREFTADAFPASGILRLGLSPLLAIDSVKYLDKDGEEQTLSADVYTADTQSEPGALVLKVDQDWPDTAALPSCVRIRYTCGATPLPALKQAIIFIAAYWYEQRLPVNVGNIVNEMPLSAAAIIAANRVFNT